MLTFISMAKAQSVHQVVLESRGEGAAFQGRGGRLTRGEGTASGGSGNGLLGLLGSQLLHCVIVLLLLLSHEDIFPPKYRNTHSVSITPNPLDIFTP